MEMRWRKDKISICSPFCLISIFIAFKYVFASIIIKRSVSRTALGARWCPAYRRHRSVEIVVSIEL